jgi:hypothetical protein
MEFIQENTPFGWTQCCKCNYKAQHKEFNVDIISNKNNTKILNSPLGLKVVGKNEDYLTISYNKDKLVIDGELFYINSIELNKLELEILIYKLTEICEQLDN